MRLLFLWLSWVTVQSLDTECLGSATVGAALLQLPTTSPAPNNTLERLLEAQEADQTAFTRLRNMTSIIEDDMQSFLHSWFEGFGPDYGQMASAAVRTVLGIAWLIFYFSYLYQTDRQPPDATRGESKPEEPDELAADMVLVFHHPSKTSASLGKAMSAESLHRLQPCPASTIHGTSDFVNKVLKVSSSQMDVGKSVLQGLCEELPLMGFDTHVFSSVDYERLFLCISLRKYAAIDYYLTKGDYHLPIRSEIVEKLGIKQSKDDPTCAPSVRYDQRTLDSLQNAGILTEKSFHEIHDEVPSGADKARIIYKEISELLNLDAAVDENVIVDQFPSHNLVKLEQLRAASKSLRGSLGLSLSQPVTMLKDYVGARLAFNFAWTGSYARALLGLFPPALLAVYLGKGPLLLGFPVVFLVWGRMAANLWRRDEDFFAAQWDRDQVSLASPYYRGELLPSPVDGNILERQAPPLATRCWRFLSYCVMFFFAVFTGLCLFAWQRAYDGQMGTYGSLGLTGLITIFGFLFDYVLDWMMSIENHKWPRDHYNSFVWKSFVMQALLRYFALMYLIFQEHCDTSECVATTRSDLISTSGSLSATEIALALVSVLQVKLSMWYEDWKLGKEVKRPWVEVQSKYGQVHLRAQTSAMVAPVISLGYIFLFGSVQPILVPLAFAVFFVHLRASYYILEHCSQRPFPRDLEGVGMWEDAVSSLLTLGLLTTAFLVSFYGDTFRGAPWTAQLFGFGLFVIIVAIAWHFADLVFPPADGAAELLKQKRKYVESKAVVVGLPKPRTKAAAGSMDSKIAESIRSAAWSDIPRGDGAKLNATPPP
mmetsp:Transcript_52187/g.93605  ORF Transcript_52187/g.93605 Transcript_52187/m.93605 type:complete len:824 (+) Transcript_52187:102-2573(+)